ncbi:ATP-binding protein [Amycolatopsis benzoatilytica]|uniref:ATP-binding protein n=1 Tax=Amycolatopsis benzoatilytica TaxID=346045 RepID=UPI0004809F3A|nr:helix-turn-helix domain-containing protein [Amycolatopsis benzoatilytica]
MTPVGDDAATFKTLLLSYRLRADLTQEELSEGSGVSVRAISDMERGVAKSPQRRTVEALARPLRLSPDELAQLQQAGKAGRARPLAELPCPAVLPSDLDDLTGHETDLEILRELAARSRRSAGVAVLSGPPGTGKTSLAVRTAHDLAGQFPDGQVFLKLRGMSAEPAGPADLLHLVLRSVGVDAVRIPPGLDDRVNLCRSILHDRAVLFVLDDAADEAQVRPLLVGGPRCLTLVTSRQMLVGLEGPQRLNLTELTPDDAVALLTAIVGPGRVAREPAAAAEVAELCGRLPLAIRIAGNRLASRPAWPLSRLVEQLRDQGRRLTTLTAGDLSVRSVFDLSYRQLTPSAARVFRLLALNPSADFSPGAASALTEAADEDEAALFLEELADASLLQSTALDGRYQFHDLLRVFATERLAQEESRADVDAARARLEDWLGETATAAGNYFQPSVDLTTAPVPTRSFADHVGAGRWLAAEQQGWSAAARRAAGRGRHQQVLDLAESMHWYSELGGTADLWEELFTLARDSALAIGSKRDEAVHANYLAWVQTTLKGQNEAAIRTAGQALAAAVAAGDAREQGWARLYTLTVAVRTGALPVSGELFDEVIRLFDEAGYQYGSIVARSVRATYWHTNGRFADAAAELEECLAFFRQPVAGTRTPTDDISVAYLLMRSTRTLASLGSVELALSRCEEALRVFQDYGATMGQARALATAGELVTRLGDPAKAHERFAEALELYERTGMGRAQVEVLTAMADLSDQLGAHSVAQEERQRALSRSEQAGAAPGDALPPKKTANRVTAS